jgi:hypothetical protein
MRALPLKHIFAVFIMSASCSLALAQYVWLDAKGVKQYSDMPPPASVPSARILKSPGAALPQAESPAPAEEQAASEADAAKKPMTLAEKDAAFQKRKAEQAEKDKQAADKAKAAADKKKDCERTQAYNRALESGQRISRVDQSGERVYLSDEERAKETRDTRRMLDQCK